MLAIVSLVLFSAGAGIFVALSAMERKVYPLFWRGSVTEEVVREVQAVLHLLVDVLPLAMMAIVFGSGILIGVQAWMGALDQWRWPILGTYAIALVLILWKLFPTIRAVKQTDPLSGPIEAVESLTRDTIIIHHLGLALTIAMIPMFGAVISSS